jgi:cytochrome c553
MRIATWLGALGVLACAVAFPVAAQQTATSPAASPTQPVCAACHEDKWTSIAISAHGAKI